MFNVVIVGLGIGGCRTGSDNIRLGSISLVLLLVATSLLLLHAHVVRRRQSAGDLLHLVRQPSYESTIAFFGRFEMARDLAVIFVPSCWYFTTPPPIFWHSLQHINNIVSASNEYYGINLQTAIAGYWWSPSCGIECPSCCNVSRRPDE